jgi:hypothetical protein
MSALPVYPNIDSDLGQGALRVATGIMNKAKWTRGLIRYAAGKKYKQLILRDSFNQGP